MREVAIDHRRKHGEGYMLRKTTKGMELEHRVLAEKALGRPLTRPAEVHHANADRLDNANANLVICPDRGYHMTLHQRERALEACGNAGWRKCKFCKRYDSPDQLVIASGKSSYHQACNSAYYRHRKARNAKTN